MTTNEKESAPDNSYYRLSNKSFPKAILLFSEPFILLACTETQNRINGFSGQVSSCDGFDYSGLPDDSKWDYQVDSGRTMKFSIPPISASKTSWWIICDQED